MRLGHALLVGSLLARVLAAQNRGEFTPFAGAYLPTSDLAVVSDAGCKVNDTYRQKIGFNVGGRFTVWKSSSSVGFEGTGEYARSTLRFTTPGGGHFLPCPATTTDYGTGIIVAHLRILLVPSWGESHGRCVGVDGWRALECAYVSAGLGIVARSGDVWTNASGTTSVAGELGFGYRRPIAPSVTLRIELEDVLYSANVTVPCCSSWGSRFQHDFQATIGFAFSGQHPVP